MGNAPNPTGIGGFKKGVSGNPSGRPKGSGVLSEMAKEHTDAALKTLIDMLTDDDAPHASKIAAAQAILDRGYGKAVQHNINEEKKSQSEYLREMEEREDVIEKALEESGCKVLKLATK